MNATTYHPPLNQIAFSVVDLRRTEAWFHEGLGFLPAGGSIFLMSSPFASRTQGVPGAASCGWWLVGRNPWFQLELFQFRRPIAKLMPADFRPCDIGYTRIGVHVTDFDAALANLARMGTRPLAPVQGERGKRRACVRNPDGVYVEIMEDDPLPQPSGSERANCPAAIRSVTMSTPDLEASVAYLTAINGHGPEEIALHAPEHEALWGLPGARCKRAVFRSGDILLEIVQYLDPIGKPWPPGYKICDQGILNIAYGARNKADLLQVYERARAYGARPNWKPFHIDNAGVVYMNDKLGFSVEVLWMKPGSRDRKYGFEPLPRDDRPQPDNRKVAATVRIAAPLDRVWQVLNDHESYSEWSGFDNVRVSRAGAPQANGVGLERVMSGGIGVVTEQIVAIEPQQSIRYRVTEGAPFNYHRGEISLRAQGGETEVHWQIGFRGKLPLAGTLIRSRMQKMLSRMLERGLKPYVERGAARP